MTSLPGCSAHGIAALTWGSQHMFIRAYLRASTSEQDASRARGALDAFVAERGMRIGARYIENESGATLVRPALFRLLADSDPGDVLLIEQVDRLSRLTARDWQRLCAEIDEKQLRIVALDLPTSWNPSEPTDDFTSRMFVAMPRLLPSKRRQVTSQKGGHVHSARMSTS